MAESPRWKSALNVARVDCRRNRSSRVDRHGDARYSRALIFVSGWSALEVNLRRNEVVPRKALTFRPRG